MTSHHVQPLLFTDVVPLQPLLPTTIIVPSIVPSILSLFSSVETVDQSKPSNSLSLDQQTTTADCDQVGTTGQIKAHDLVAPDTKKSCVFSSTFWIAGCILDPSYPFTNSKAFLFLPIYNKTGIDTFVPISDTASGHDCQRFLPPTFV